MSALPDGGAVDLLDHQRLFLAGLIALEGHGADAGLGGIHIHRFVYITVGMTGDGDGLLPVLDHGLDGGDADGGAEDRAVQNGADGAIGALPHLGELGIFLHALLVGGDGGALDAHAVFFVGVGGIDGHLILRGVAVQQAQVIVFGLQVHIGRNQLVLDHLPEDAGHLVAVHLDQRRFHLNFSHCKKLLYDFD